MILTTPCVVRRVLRRDDGDAVEVDGRIRVPGVAARDDRRRRVLGPLGLARPRQEHERRRDGRHGVVVGEAPRGVQVVDEEGAVEEHADVGAPDRDDDEARVREEQPGQRRQQEPRRRAQEGQPPHGVGEDHRREREARPARQDGLVDEEALVPREDRRGRRAGQRRQDDRQRRRAHVQIRKGRAGPRRAEAREPRGAAERRRGHVDRERRVRVSRHALPRPQAIGHERQLPDEVRDAEPEAE